MAQQLADARTAMGQCQQQAAQQLADFQLHVYKVLGQTRTQHQSRVDQLTDQLAEKRQEISDMAASAGLASTAAQAAADAADHRVAALEADAEHSNAELAGMQLEAEAQRKQLAALQIVVACQGMAARNSKLRAWRRLASLCQENTSLKPCQPLCQPFPHISRPASGNFFGVMSIDQTGLVALSET